MPEADEARPNEYVPLRRMVRACVVCGGPYTSPCRATKTCGPACAYPLRAASLSRVPVGQYVGGDAPAPTVRDSGSVNAEPVAEITRPSPWTTGTYADKTGTYADTTDRYVAPTSQRSSRYLRVLIWPDTHLPYADPKAVSLALQIGKYYQPDLVILLGDMLDCTGFSRFPHDQINPKSFLQTELDEWHSLAESIREMAPHAERRFILGNHEDRIERWLWSQPQLYGLTGMRLASLLTLGEHGFRPEVEREITLCNGSLTVTHGTRIGGQGSGLAARQELQRFGTSTVTGHTHRLALVTVRDKVGLRQGIESGHLSLNPPHYAPSVQNWTQGVTIGEISACGNDFELRPVPFRLSYRALVDGREFSA